MENASAARRDFRPYASYTLGFLTLISSFNYLDRTILGLALQSIKAEMRVSDTMLGLVSGLAFVVFYSLLGVPIAWLADRRSRRNIIAVGFAFWSLMTVLTGFVANIWQLAAARFLMGAGEAAGLAPSNSMLSDVFRGPRRPLALAIFGTGNSLASLAFFPIAGWFAEHHGWRSMFIASGLPGLILALLFFLTVKEPERGAAEETTTKRNFDAEPFAKTVRFLAGSRAYLFMLAGSMFLGSNVFAAGAWTPAFLQRVHGLRLGEVASSIGPIRGVLGALGILAGGVVIDRLGRRDERWRVRLPAIACVLLGPAEILFLLGESRLLWMTGLGIASFLMLLHMGPIFAAALSVAKLRMRALATSLMVLFASLLGQALGPLCVGALNDRLQPQFGNHAIRYSLLVIAASAVLGGLCFWSAAKHLAADRERAREAG
jgi:MFS family permease